MNLKLNRISAKGGYLSDHKIGFISKQKSRLYINDLNACYKSYILFMTLYTKNSTVTHSEQQFSFALEKMFLKTTFFSARFNQRFLHN